MHRIGAVRVSRELAVEQRDLVQWLEQILDDPSVAAEWRRHQRVIGRIVELKAETAARAVKIVLPDPEPSVELPDGVSLRPGLLTVSFDSEQQLLERLFLLARVLASQPDVLKRRMASTGCDDDEHDVRPTPAASARDSVVTEISKY